MKYPGNRAKLMGGIIFRIAMNIIFQAVMTVFLSKGDFFPQIMLITPFAVHNLSQNPLLRHAENHHFIPAIDAVFHKHNGSLRFLVAIHQLPTLRQGIRAPHLGGHRLSCPHGRHGYFAMGIPGSTNQDCIQLFDQKHLSIVGKGLRSFSSHLH